MTIGGALPARRVIVLGLLAALLVAAISGYVAARASGEPTGRCQAFAQAAAARLAHDSGSGTRVVVIGDSYSVGLGLDHPAASWPSRLPGRVHVSGFSGSGFAEHDSACGKVSYADRAPAAVRGGASVVVIEGGLNDWNQSEAAIVAGFDRLASELHGYRVVVVGPAAAPSRAVGAAHVDALLRLLCTEHHLRYVPMLGLDLPYQDDDLHPTQQGQDAFGDRVAARPLIARPSP